MDKTKTTPLWHLVVSWLAHTGVVGICAMVVLLLPYPLTVALMVIAQVAGHWLLMDLLNFILQDEEGDEDE